MTGLPEFNVSVKMARKTGPLHSDVEYRTFSIRTPAMDADNARDAGFGLGQGVNEATDHAWKFAGALTDDGIVVTPADDEKTEIERLRAELAEANAEVRSVTNQLTHTVNDLAQVRNQAHRDATNHQQIVRANTELANERDAQAAVIAAVSAIHEPVFNAFGQQRCKCCGALWPCATHKAISTEPTEVTS